MYHNKRFQVRAVHTTALLLGLSICASITPMKSNAEQGKAMASLTIDLQAGFTDDHVVINAGSKEIFQLHNVSTDYSLGLANSVTVQVPVGNIEIQITVPTRQLSGTFDLSATGAVYLGVSLEADGIEFKMQKDAFTYF